MPDQSNQTPPPPDTDQAPPAQTPSSVIRHLSSTKPRRFIPWFIAFIALLVVASGALALYSLTKPQEQDLLPPPVPTLEVQPSTSPTTSPEQQVYSYPTAGFTFTYPGNVELTQRFDYFTATNLELYVNTSPIANAGQLATADIEYTQEMLEVDQQTLDRGEFGETWALEYKDSRQVVDINGHYIKTYTMYETPLDAGGIQLTMTAMFYPSPNHVSKIILHAPVQTIIEQNPNYFTTMPIEYKIWDYQNGAVDSFHQKLMAGELSPAAQNWLNTFNDIIETLEFTPPLSPTPAPIIDLEAIPQFDAIKDWSSTQATQQVFVDPLPFLDSPSLPGTRYTLTRSRFSRAPEIFNPGQFVTDLTFNHWQNELQVGSYSYPGIIADSPAGNTVTYIARNQNQFRAIIFSTQNGCYDIKDDTTDCSYTTDIFISDITTLP